MSTLIQGDQRLILALDVPHEAQCHTLIEQTHNVFGVYKLGLGAVTGGYGIALARALSAAGYKIFLDLKLFDIENTVRDATARLADAGLHMLTVQGDPHTVRAAVAGRGNSALQIYAVSVLTGLPSTTAQVMERVSAAAAEGADGVIASGHECAAIKQKFANLRVVTPGIRPLGSAANDQQRIMTPAQALQQGADALVIGRPITAAPCARTAALALAGEL